MRNVSFYYRGSHVLYFFLTQRKDLSHALVLILFIWCSATKEIECNKYNFHCIFETKHHSTNAQSKKTCTKRHTDQQHQRRFRPAFSSSPFYGQRRICSSRTHQLNSRSDPSTFCVRRGKIIIYLFITYKLALVHVSFSSFLATIMSHISLSIISKFCNRSIHIYLASV